MLYDEILNQFFSTWGPWSSSGSTEGFLGSTDHQRDWFDFFLKFEHRMDSVLFLMRDHSSSQTEMESVTNKRLRTTVLKESWPVWAIEVKYKESVRIFFFINLED